MGARTGTYPEELPDSTLEVGDELLIRRDNTIFAIPATELGGGGGGGSWVREDVTFSTSEIANNETETGTVVVSSLYQLLQISIDKASRVRIYTDGLKRDEDILRPIGTDPVGNHGLLFEFVGDASFLQADLTPTVMGFATTSDIPFSITNLSGNNDTIDVTLNHIKLGV